MLINLAAFSGEKVFVFGEIQIVFPLKNGAYSKDVVSKIVETSFVGAKKQKTLQWENNFSNFEKSVSERSRMISGYSACIVINWLKKDLRLFSVEKSNELFRFKKRVSLLLLGTEKEHSLKDCSNLKISEASKIREGFFALSKEAKFFSQEISGTAVLAKQKTVKLPKLYTISSVSRFTPSQHL